MTLKPGLGSLKDIKNYTIQSGTHDFPLTFDSNHQLILHRFRDEQRFPPKIANPPVYLTPPQKGFPLELDTGMGLEETRMMGLPDGQKSFKIGLAVLIQYWRVSDRHPASQVALAITCYAHLRCAVKMKVYVLT